MEGGEEMTTSGDINIEQIRQILLSFLQLFEQYSAEIFGAHRRTKLDNLRHRLQRLEPEVTHYILQILGNGGGLPPKKESSCSVRLEL